MFPTNRLEKLRRSREWTQRDLADRLAPQPNGRRLHVRTIDRWELGAYPIPPRRAAELADLLGVSVPYLLGYDGNGENGSNGEKREQAA